MSLPQRRPQARVSSAYGRGYPYGHTSVRRSPYLQSHNRIGPGAAATARGPAQEDHTPMHHHPNPHDALAQAILALLTEVHAGLWSLHELKRTLAPTAPHDTDEAVQALHGAGLLPRAGGCVFASRAAHTAQRLAA